MNRANFLFNRDAQFDRSIIVDTIQILALYFFSILVVYKLPGVTGYILFSLIIIQFYRSKNDYFWLAFFFALSTGPGGFFYVTEEVMTGQLPVFRLGGGINISVTEIFLGVALLKALIKGKKQKITLSKPLIMIMFYCLLLFLVSVLFFDATLIRVLKDLRYFFYYFSIIPIYYLVYKEGHARKLIYCIFAFVFVSFFAALFFVFTGEYLVNIFAPGLMRRIALGISEGGARYITSSKGGHLLLLLSYIMALFLTLIEIKAGRRNKYPILVAGMCYATILLTATRVWFVVFTFIFLMSIVFLQRNMKILGLVLIAFILFYIPYLLVPQIHNFANNAWTRIESVFSITEKGSIAYQMIERKKKDRLYDTLEGIKKSPLLGWGVSDQFYKLTRGGDIGNFNLILRVGLIGFLLFANFWRSFFLFLWKVNRKLSVANYYQRMIFLFNIALLGLLIAHFTTHQLFAMLTTQADSVFIMLFIFFTDFFCREALLLEYRLHEYAGTGYNKSA